MGRNRYDDAVAFLQGCLEIWRRKLDPGDEAIAAAIRKLAEHVSQDAGKVIDLDNNAANAD